MIHDPGSMATMCLTATTSIFATWGAMTKARHARSASLAETLRREQLELRGELRNEIDKLTKQLTIAVNASYLLIGELIKGEPGNPVALQALGMLDGMMGLGNLRQQMQTALSEQTTRIRDSDGMDGSPGNSADAEKAASA